MRRYLDIFRRGFWENVRFAFSSIREHKLRAGLTTLGIVVGVTTVMGMVAIVAGFNNNVIGNLQAFGANRIEFQKYEESFGPGEALLEYPQYTRPAEFRGWTVPEILLSGDHGKVREWRLERSRERGERSGS